MQRWLKFAKYLPEFGFKPVIYTPSNPTFPIVDRGLLEEIPQQCTVVKRPIKEPYAWAALWSKKNTTALSAGLIPKKTKQGWLEKLMLWVRGNCFIPDARVGWVKPSVRYLKKYLQEHQIDTVITTGPPHSVHLIGKELKAQLGIRWIADFRDPWTTIAYHKEMLMTEQARAKHLQQELAVLNQADDILVTSPSTRAEFELKTPKPVHLITNGYDVEHLPRTSLDEKFTLAHIGSFLSDRNPRVLWKAISEMRKENPQFRAHFQLKLIGKTSEEILAAVAEFKLADCTVNMGYVSHREALIQQRKSQVLLLVEIDSDQTKAIIPGKLFEYLAAERPILAIGPEEADFFKIIQQTNTGKIALYDQKDAIKDILQAYFDLYLKAQLKVHGMGLQYYSRKKLTEQLSQILSQSKG